MREYASPPLLAGALSGFALADVLQLLELGARTGVLVVDGGPTGGGRVWIRDGRIGAASVHGANAPNAGPLAERVAALLELSAGRWEFQLPDEHAAAAGTVSPGAEVRISAVLVEAARLRDERSHAAAMVLPEEDVPQVADVDSDPEVGAPAVRLTSLDLHVLAAIDGVRTSGEIATTVRRDLARVLDALGRLRAAGVVRATPARVYAECGA